MKVLPINQLQNFNNFTTSKKSEKANLITNLQSFKGKNYQQVMNDVLGRNLNCSADVKKAMSDLYFALDKEPGVVSTPVKKVLSSWLAEDGTNLIWYLCKPIAKIPSALRDIVFDSEDDNLDVFKKSGDSLLYIRNSGKHGFWNSVFDNESARNNIAIVFSSKDGSFEVSTNKDRRLVTRQSYYNTGYWVKNIYHIVWGDLIERKTGNSSDTIICPPF